MDFINARLLAAPEESDVVITSGEMELASAAFDNGDFIVLIDDARVYRVLDGYQFIGSTFKFNYFSRLQ